MKKIRQSPHISSVDCKNLLVGNPGIGGTEYCVLLLAQAYKMYYSNNKVTLFVAKQGMQRLMLWEMESYMVGIQNWENIILQKILMRSSLCQD